MTQGLVIYVGLGIVVILLTSLLLRGAGKDRGKEMEKEMLFRPPAWDPDALGIARRIFDPSDYLWLRHTLKAPVLAQEVAATRKSLARQWLSQTEDDFHELIRTFRENPHQITSRGRTTELIIDWHTLCFHALMIFTRLSVSLLGPWKTLSSFAWPAGYLVFLREHPTLKQAAALRSKRS